MNGEMGGGGYCRDGWMDGKGNDIREDGEIDVWMDVGWVE